MVVEKTAQVNPWDISTWERSQKSKFIFVPDEICIYNACNDRCDCINFACACGGWHSIEDFTERLETLQMKVIVEWLATLPDLRKAQLIP